jgi:hypothetical protein
MSFRRSLSLPAAFVLAGAGFFLLLSWIYYLLGWYSGGLFFQPTPNLALVAAIIGAGIGLLSWLGFAIGKQRRSRAGEPSGGHAPGTYLRSFGVGLLVFLALGTLTGLIIAVPRALGQTAVNTGSEQGVTLDDVITYVFIYGSLAVVPLVTGLLTGSRARPGAVLAFLGGLALAIGGAIVYLLPVSLLIVLVHGPVPACATADPPACSFIYFSPSFDAEIIDLLGLWAAITVGIAASAAAFVGVAVMGLTDGA